MTQSERILATLDKHGGLKIKDLMEVMPDVSRHSLEAALSKLRAKKRAERTSSGLWCAVDSDGVPTEKPRAEPSKPSLEEHPMQYEVREPTPEFRWAIKPEQAPSRVLQQRWRIVMHGPVARGAWYVDRYDWVDVPVVELEAQG